MEGKTIVVNQIDLCLEGGREEMKEEGGWGGSSKLYQQLDGFNTLRPFFPSSLSPSLPTCIDSEER
jgi:hypothetical protein